MAPLSYFGVEYGLLGPLEVRRDGAVLDLGSPKQRALLAMLLMHANHVVSVDRIIEDLWNGDPPDRAAGAVHAYVSLLRRALEPTRSPRAPATVLVSEAPGYVLRTDPSTIDGARFELLVSAGRAALETDAHAALRAYDEAMQLWRGPVLADFASEPWSGGVITRYDALRNAVVEERFDARLRLGQHHALVPELEAAVQHNPLHERLWEQLMLALYRSGRQTDALRAYGRVRTLLADEIGLEPGAGLQLCQARILRQDPTLMIGTSVSVVPRAAPTTVDSPRLVDPFIGRDAELEVLDHAFRRAEAGHGAVVVITGYAGAGKTRLVEEALRRNPRRAGWGRGVDGHAAPALWPLLQIATSLGSDGVDLAAALNERPIEHADDANAARNEMAARTVAAIREAAADGPMTMVLDDLQWIDTATLRIVRLLISSMSAMTITLVLAIRTGEVRTDELQATIDDAARADSLRIELSGLDRGEIADQATALLGQRPRDDVTELLHERTGGNVFLLREVLRQIGHPDVLDDADRVARVLPANVVDVVARRTAQLPEHAGTILTVAAVLGQQFDQRVVSELSGLAIDVCLDGLDIAAVTGLIEPHLTSTRHRFRHDLVREAIYLRTSTSTRQRLHARAVEVLSGLYDGATSHADELAHHAWLGREELPVEAVVQILDDAATAMFAAFAYEDADALLVKALQAVEGERDTNARGRLELLIATRLVRIRVAARGYGDAATVAAIERASTTRHTDPSGAAMTDLHVELSHHASYAGDTSSAEHHARAVVDLARIAGDLHAEAVGYFRQGSTELLRGRVTQGIDLMHRSIEIGRRLASSAPAGGLELHPLPDSLSVLAIMLKRTGDEVGARTAAAEADQQASVVGSAANRAWVAMVHIWLCLLDDDPHAAWRRFEHYRSTAGRAAGSLTDATADLAAAWAQSKLGDPDGALDRVRRARRILAASDTTGPLVAVYIEADVLIDAGQADQGLVLIDAWLSARHVDSEGQWLPDLYRVKARAHAAMGATNDAREALEAALQAAMHEGAAPLTARIRADLEAVST
ncbi:MAG: transcriptional regulator, putative ATPase, winged helix family [Ilumatobacteraceae bacterium]|nr:transcriptional regulator, putative ATPase, winged helix family [Ilumatobacteraceae bacterium]